ncbi:hypothetical protein [Roseibium sp. RKSG952]|uniref:hypothetical protein n=1 Tax=Roseibium sp. RKSG952 TaxID=2529384 RepID=UPI0012BBB6DB|nr:hypothetical protein [Roseibium sp. RKSG952]MTH98195.1 hypothetical protein [Roseibium sp. RKSG952]
MRYDNLLNSFKRLAAGAVVAATATIGLAGTAAADSPFHTGVWQLNTEAGAEGLVISDWLVFEHGLPKRWLYRRAGTNDTNQFDFYTRTIGDKGYTPVGLRVYRTGNTSMKLTIAEKGKTPMEASATRLSLVNHMKSCLSVEENGAKLYGSWAGTAGSTLKSLHIDQDSLKIDGETRRVSVEPVRVGRLGISQDGKPVAFLTDAGGDYAVLQWFKPGVTQADMRDQTKEILDFKAEEIVRTPYGTCDRQIASRLKAMR